MGRGGQTYLQKQETSHDSNNSDMICWHRYRRAFFLLYLSIFSHSLVRIRFDIYYNWFNSLISPPRCFQLSLETSENFDLSKPKRLHPMIIKAIDLSVEIQSTKEKNL